MKIICNSRISFDDNLTTKIKELEDKVGLNKHRFEIMPRHIQRVYLLVLQDFVEYHFSDHREHIIDETPEEEIDESDTQTYSFSKFGDLPIEIRLTMYEYSFASELNPKIHCVDERTSKTTPSTRTFISNQAISPILHVCQESRAHYLFVTKACFAFETYINFSIDTIYVPDFASREEQFPRFLECESAKKIQKLAMRKDFYCNFPGHEIMWHKYMDMVRALPCWKELSCVFNDNLSRMEVWDKCDLSFRDLSARQKRSGPGACERGFARLWTSILNRKSSTVGLREIHYRFVVPENV